MRFQKKTLRLSLPKSEIVKTLLSPSSKNSNLYDRFIFFCQSAAGLDVVNLRGRGAFPLVQDGDGRLLHRLLRRLPLLLRKHLRGARHRHVQRARGGRANGQHRQEPGQAKRGEMI